MKTHALSSQNVWWDIKSCRFSIYSVYRCFKFISDLVALLPNKCASFFQALLKMDCQGLVARLIMDFVLLTTAVEVAPRWRELAEKLAHVSRQQMEAYEAPHRDKTGVVDSEVRHNISSRLFIDIMAS